jgi:acyl-coenzyme A thioesterase PaaI-like protein
MYAAVMGLYGNEPRVLSSDLAMNFLRRAPDQALLGRCTVLGLDAKRALARTEIVPESGDGRLICLVTANYALP